MPLGIKADTHLQYVILWIQLAYRIHLECLPLERGQLQQITLVDATDHTPISRTYSFSISSAIFREEYDYICIFYILLQVFALL